MTTATLSAFAALLGRSPSYVTKLKQAGRLKLVDGKVDVEASQALMAATEGVRDDMREIHERARAAEPAAPEPVPEPTEDNTEPGYGTRAYWERMDREEVARIRKLERQKLEGSLVERAAVEFVLNDFGATLRRLLDNLADRLAPQVYPLTTLEETRAVIQEAMDDTQREMAATMKRRLDGLTP